MTKFKFYQEITYFQNIIHFQGTGVNVILLMAVRKVWFSPPQISQNLQISNMICADLVRWISPTSDKKRVK
jgi:hypothetical protein